MIEEFTQYAKEFYTPQTFTRYKREVEEFNKKRNAITATYEDVQDYFKGIKSTVGHVVKSALQAYFDFLVNTNKRIDNPLKLIEISRQRKDIQHNLLLSSEELDLLLRPREERYSALKWRNLFMLSLIRYQGLTNLDIIELKLSDIKLDEYEEDEIIIKPKTGLNGKTYALQGRQARYWEKYEEVRKNELLKGDVDRTDKVFLNKRGYPITNDGVSAIVNTLKPLFPYKKVNLKVLRSSVIAEKARETNDIISTQNFARHKWSSTTMKYFDIATEDLRNEVEKLHPFKKM